MGHTYICSGTYLTVQVLADLVRRVAGEPESEVGVHFVFLELVTDLLQCWHPRHSQVAVLQHHPCPVTGGCGYQPRGNGTLGRRGKG